MAETFNITLDMDKAKRHSATITACVGEFELP